MHIFIQLKFQIWRNNKENKASSPLIRTKSSLFYELSLEIVKFFYFSKIWIIQNILFITFEYLASSLHFYGIGISNMKK